MRFCRQPVRSRVPRMGEGIQKNPSIRSDIAKFRAQLDLFKRHTDPPMTGLWPRALRSGRALCGRPLLIEELPCLDARLKPLSISRVSQRATQADRQPEANEPRRNRHDNAPLALKESHVRSIAAGIRITPPAQRPRAFA